MKYIKVSYITIFVPNCVLEDFEYHVVFHFWSVLGGLTIRNLTFQLVHRNNLHQSCVENAKTQVVKDFMPWILPVNHSTCLKLTHWSTLSHSNGDIMFDQRILAVSFFSIMTTTILNAFGLSSCTAFGTSHALELQRMAGRLMSRKKTSDFFLTKILLKSVKYFQQTFWNEVDFCEGRWMVRWKDIGGVRDAAFPMHVTSNHSSHLMHIWGMHHVDVCGWEQH